MKKSNEKCCCIPLLSEWKKKHMAKMKEKKFSKEKICLIHSLPAIIVIIAALYLLKGKFIVAVVNNKPIFRHTLVKDLEKQAGKKALDSIIVKELILQKAKKENIQITDEEIDQEITKIEESLSAQGQEINLLLEQQGMSLKSLKQELKIQKIVEKIVKKDITITDEEVEALMLERKDFYPAEQDPEETKSQLKEQLTEQKTGEAIQAWVSKLQEEAKILYWAEAYKLQ